MVSLRHLGFGFSGGFGCFLAGCFGVAFASDVFLGEVGIELDRLGLTDAKRFGSELRESESICVLDRQFATCAVSVHERDRSRVIDIRNEVAALAKIRLRRRGNNNER